MESTNNLTERASKLQIIPTSSPKYSVSNIHGSVYHLFDGGVFTTHSLHSFTRSAVKLDFFPLYVMQRMTCIWKIYLTAQH